MYFFLDMEILGLPRTKFSRYQQMRNAKRQTKTQKIQLPFAEGEPAKQAIEGCWHFPVINAFFG